MSTSTRNGFVSILIWLCKGLWDVERDGDGPEEGFILKVYVNLKFSKRTIWKGGFYIIRCKCGSETVASDGGSDAEGFITVHLNYSSLTMCCKLGQRAQESTLHLGHVIGQTSQRGA
ncbi:hypothetical protein V6N13_128548 [Hibiscus sabdariffa]